MNNDLQALLHWDQAVTMAVRDLHRAGFSSDAIRVTHENDHSAREDLVHHVKDQFLVAVRLSNDQDVLNAIDILDRRGGQIILQDKSEREAELGEQTIEIVCP